MAFFIFPRAIPKKECNKYLKYCLQNSNFEDASTITKGYSDTFNTKKDVEDKIKRQQFDYEMRKTDVSFIVDKDNLMNDLVWDFIREANKQFFNYKLDYFQAIQFARYKNGGHYDWHQDAAGIVGNQKEHRKLSLTMSLTDHTTYDGGYLEFYNGSKPLEHDEHDIAKDVKDQGSVIVFDSRDGHSVAPVTKGERYSIVCWTVGPNFV